MGNEDQAQKQQLSTNIQMQPRGRPCHFHESEALGPFHGCADVNSTPSPVTSSLHGVGLSVRSLECLCHVAAEFPRGIIQE